ncbi:MAG TPA: Lrp/AsnC family transcriptional regulator [Dehalococcoidia bacterium]|nr:Lrp/AsnC family transcriptional regulator [Dehalococcoidia bacterium]
MKLDNIDRNLLSIIQSGFPLTPKPFAILGQQLGISSNDIICRSKRLKEEGVIRQIGPVFNPQRLGYHTTLVALKVATERVDAASQIMSTHPMVSHCYQRNHDFNLWFTLALHQDEDMNKEVYRLSCAIRAEATAILPAVKVFKIRAYFAPHNTISHPSPSTTEMVPNKNSGIDSGLSADDRAIINELQQDLPIIERPFDLMSTKLSIDTEEFLSKCRALQNRGIMRRFSASINHNKLGFKANAMVCWIVPQDKIETAGKVIARHPQASHCHERRTTHLWQYNLFAMIHAVTTGDCKTLASTISTVAGLKENELVLLFSTKEIKKTRSRYQV